MTHDIHPNLSILQRLDLQDLNACKSILADDLVWHYVNPQLPALDGDYQGLEGLQAFFCKTG